MALEPIQKVTLDFDPVSGKAYLNTPTGSVETVSPSDLTEAVTASAASATAAEGFKDLAEGARDDTLDLFNGVMVRGDTILVDGELSLGLLGADDLTGLFRYFIAMMADGSIKSPAIVDLINGQLAGVEFDAATNIAGYVFALIQRDAGGLPRIVAGLRDDQTWYPPTGPVASGRTCFHVVITGQSNAAADGAVPVLSTTPLGWGTKTFARAIGPNTWQSGDHNADPENRDPSGFELVDLVESGVETRASGMAAQLKSLFTNRYRPSSPLATDDYVMVTSTALGSRRLADIGPLNDRNEGQYLTMLSDIEFAKARVEADGDAYVLLAVIVDQGEKEGDLKLTDGGSTLTPSALISGYKAEAIQFAEEFDAAARAVTGQTTPILTYVMPATYNQYTPEAWQQASEETDLIRFLGGRGVFQSALAGTRAATAQSIHYSSDGQKADIGTRSANVLFEDFFLLQPSRCPRLIGAEAINPTVVRYTFDTKHPLVIDAESMPQVEDYGLSIYGGTVDNPTGRQMPVSPPVVLSNGYEIEATYASIPSAAFVSFSGSRMTAIAFPAISSVGSVTVEGVTGFSVTVAGDFADELAPLVALGHFVLYGSGAVISEAVIREVEVSGGNTILRGRVDERRTGGSYVAFQAGQAIVAGHTSPYSNIRDTDPAISRIPYATGTRAGTYPNQYNWPPARIGLAVEGA